MDTLRSALQPLTHSLPRPLVELGTSLLGPQCYILLIHDIDLLPLSKSQPCLQLAISKLLSIGIIAGSSIVKIPQLLKIIQARSGKGVSFIATALETAAMVISLSYSARSGLAFSTYGETALISVQNLFIGVCVLLYGSGGEQQQQGARKNGNNNAVFMAGTFVAVVAASVAALLDERVVSMGLLRTLQAGGALLAVGSKVPQIYTIYSQGGTGQLSAFTVFNYLVGSLARVYTTIQEVDDALILYGFLAGLVLNAVLAAQMVYYWNSSSTAPHAAEAGKTAEKIAMDPVGSITTGATPKPKGPTTRRKG